MTNKEREEFKKKLQARKEQRLAKNSEKDLTKEDADKTESDANKKPPFLIELFRKAESESSVNLEALTPYEREELKNSYKRLTLIFSIISVILFLWVLSWAM